MFRHEFLSMIGLTSNMRIENDIFMSSSIATRRNVPSKIEAVKQASKSLIKECKKEKNIIEERRIIVI